MTELAALDIAKHALLVGLEISAPMLIASLVVGTVIGLLMAATQIQEFTLTFVPKLLALGTVVLIAGPWMLRTLITFALVIFKQIPTMSP